MRLTEGLTPGAARAISRASQRTPCKTCGFALPKYPGRYPKKCPQCDTPMDEALGIDVEPREEEPAK